jgi:hypothetical protein
MRPHRPAREGEGCVFFSYINTGEQPGDTIDRIRLGKFYGTLDAQAMKKIDAEIKIILHLP